MTEKWVLCPICGGKTRTKIRPDTEAKNLPIFCKICKNEVLMDIKDGNAVESTKKSELRKCKDCSLFMNGCGFSEFVACGQFKKK